MSKKFKNGDKIIHLSTGKIYTFKKYYGRENENVNLVSIYEGYSYTSSLDYVSLLEYRKLKLEKLSNVRN